MLRLMTAGESHGKCLIGVLEGIPHGLAVNAQFVDEQLRRRQGGYGRGGRMQIESDAIEITSGVRHGKTLGDPISFIIRNKDWEHWQLPMSSEPVSGDVNIRAVSRPRPGHADLAGALKFQTYDVRDILERASARETAARVAVGAFCALLLNRFGIRLASHVIAIGKERVAREFESPGFETLLGLDPASRLRCADPEAENRMVEAIDAAKKAGDTVGGVLEVVASPAPPGLGSLSQWDRKLDGRIAQALMSIPSAKAVEIGTGISAAEEYGSTVHDEIYYDEDSRRFYRKTNRAGGLEGGITNGSEVRARVYLKPIPTLRKPLMSADLHTKEPFEAAFERSDTCVVPAAGVIAESMLSIVLADTFLEKFGGDSVQETAENYAAYMRALDRY